MQVISTISIIVLINIVLSKEIGTSSIIKRQIYQAGPANMDRGSSPFAAFWNQGLVPGQGFPQIGMSSYGYGLPGLGLQQFLSPDAVILAGAGEGQINHHDLENMDDKIYDRFKQESHPDPAFPGCFKNEKCDKGNAVDYDNEHYHVAAGSSSFVDIKSLLISVAVLIAILS